MWLLYTAAITGWSAALYYNQQGANKFLDVPPEFWSGYQPQPKMVQHMTQARSRQASHWA
jgi:hypothetical protein